MHSCTGTSLSFLFFADLRVILPSQQGLPCKFLCTAIFSPFPFPVLLYRVLALPELVPHGHLGNKVCNHGVLNVYREVEI